MGVFRRFQIADRRRRGRWLVAGLALALVALGGDGGQPVTLSRPAQFGVDVPNADPGAFAVLAKRLGVTPTINAIFLKLDSTTALQTLRAMPPSVTPFVSLEPWSKDSAWGQSDLAQYSLSSIIDGAHDQALTALAHFLAALRRPVYLRFAHEMNGDWYPWAATVNGNSPEQYVAAWRHAYDLMRPITGADVRWVWSPNIVSGVPAGAPSPAELYPGDGYVDAVGLTGYSHGASVVATYCPTVTALAEMTSKPLVLSEIGVEGDSKSEWLADLGPFIAANPQIVAFTYFDTSSATSGATGDYRLDRTADLEALRSSLDYLAIGSSGHARRASMSTAFRCR